MATSASAWIEGPLKLSFYTKTWTPAPEVGVKASVLFVHGSVRFLPEGGSLREGRTGRRGLYPSCDTGRRAGWWRGKGKEEVTGRADAFSPPATDLRFIEHVERYNHVFDKFAEEGIAVFSYDGRGAFPRATLHSRGRTWGRRGETGDREMGKTRARKCTRGGSCGQWAPQGDGTGSASAWPRENARPARNAERWGPPVGSRPVPKWSLQLKLPSMDRYKPFLPSPC